MAAITVSTSAYVLSSGQTFAVQDNDALLLHSSSQTPPSISINGALTVTASAGARAPNWFLSGIRIGDGGFYPTTITIGSGGLLKVDTSATDLDAYGLAGGSWMPQLLNNGQIEVAAQADAFGVWAGLTHTENDTAVANAGSIQVRSDLGHAYGVRMGVGDGFANLGLINVSGAQASYGVYFYQWDSRFQNSGTIRVVDTNPNEDSYAVYANTAFAGAFVNTGVLQGDYALKFLDYNGPTADTVFPREPTRFDNAGTMIGKVDLGHLRQVLTNTGSIQGDVNLGAGADTYTGVSGTVTGMVSGGDGNDSLQGGAAFDYLQGNAGDDTVDGGGGHDWLLGGRGADVLSGGQGDNIVYGNLDNDWLAGSGGNDLVRGGQGADTLSGGDGADWLSGDKGDDIVFGGAGADVFNSFADAGVDRVKDFSRVEGDSVRLDPGTTYAVRQEGADVIVDFGGGNQMVLENVQFASLSSGWIVVG